MNKFLTIADLEDLSSLAVEVELDFEEEPAADAEFCLEADWATEFDGSVITQVAGYEEVTQKLDLYALLQGVAPAERERLQVFFS